jgi:hypothetical protein
VSAQRPYGIASCGGSAAKLMTNRSVGGIARAAAYWGETQGARKGAP